MAAHHPPGGQETVVHVCTVDGSRTASCSRIQTIVDKVYPHVSANRSTLLLRDEVSGRSPAAIMLTLTSVWAESLASLFQPGSRLSVAHAAIVPNNRLDLCDHPWRLAMGESTSNAVLELQTQAQVAARQPPAVYTLSSLQQRQAPPQHSPRMVTPSAYHPPAQSPLRPPQQPQQYQPQQYQPQQYQPRQYQPQQPQQYQPPQPQQPPQSPQPRQAGVEYTNIADLQPSAKRANIYGLVVSYTQPRPTGGTDYVSKLGVRDLSCLPGHTFEIKFFNSPDRLPQSNCLGQVIRLHNFGVDRGYADQGTAPKFSRWLIVSSSLPMENPPKVLDQSAEGWSDIDTRAVHALAQLRDRLMWEAESSEMEPFMRPLGEIAETGKLDMLARVYYVPASRMSDTSHATMHVWDGSVVRQDTMWPCLDPGQPHPRTRVLLPRFGSIVNVGVPPQLFDSRKRKFQQLVHGQWVRLLGVQCSSVYPLELFVDGYTRIQPLKFGHPKIAQLLDSYRTRRNAAWQQLAPRELDTGSAIPDAAFFDDKRCAEPHNGLPLRDPPPMGGRPAAAVAAAPAAPAAPMAAAQSAAAVVAPQAQPLVDQDSITEHDHLKMPIMSLQAVLDCPKSMPCYFRVVGRVIRHYPSDVLDWVSLRCRGCAAVYPRPIPLLSRRRERQALPGCALCTPEPGAGSSAAAIAVVNGKPSPLEPRYSLQLTLEDCTGQLDLMLADSFAANFFGPQAPPPEQVLRVPESSSRELQALIAAICDPAEPDDLPSGPSRKRKRQQTETRLGHTLDLCILAEEPEHPREEQEPASKSKPAAASFGSPEWKGPEDPWKKMKSADLPSLPSRVFRIVGTRLKLPNHVA